MKNPTIIMRLPKVDYSRLLGRMIEKHYTRRSLASAIGVSEVALGQWIRRGELMHGIVIWAIASKLSIDKSDIPHYFMEVA